MTCVANGSPLTKPGQLKVLCHRASLGICGATILSRGFLITAKHCHDPDDPMYQVSLGGERQPIFEGGSAFVPENNGIAVKWHKHPDADIALLELTPQISLKDWNTYELCSAMLTSEDLCQDGQKGYFAGWGLRAVDVDIPPHRNMYMNKGFLKISTQCPKTPFLTILDHHFCILQKENDKFRTCPGDSGGALLSPDRRVLGIQSLGRKIEGKLNSCPLGENYEPSSVFVSVCHQSVQDFLKSKLPSNLFNLPTPKGEEDVFKDMFKRFEGEEDIRSFPPLFDAALLIKNQIFWLLLGMIMFCACNLFCWLLCVLLLHLKSLPPNKVFR